MSSTTFNYENLIENTVVWGKSSPDIRGLILIGSRTRNNRPADEWADLDVVVITKKPESLLFNNEWLRQIGDPRIYFRESAALGSGQERRVLFTGGLDVDFAIIAKNDIAKLILMLKIANHPFLTRLLPKKVKQLIQMNLPQVAGLFQRGYRIILDKDGIVQQILKDAGNLKKQLPPFPPQTEFLNTIHSFWYDALWVAKHLRRGELWWAKGCLDLKMKWFGILKMAEWHAKAVHGPNYDTWHRGRFLEQWADPRVITELTNAFSHYDSADAWNSLLATMNLFSWLAQETATQLGYEYPDLVEVEAREWVKLLASKTTYKQDND